MMDGLGSSTCHVVESRRLDRNSQRILPNAGNAFPAQRKHGYEFDDIGRTIINSGLKHLIDSITTSCLPHSDPGIGLPIDHYAYRYSRHGVYLYGMSKSAVRPSNGNGFCVRSAIHARANSGWCDASGILIEGLGSTLQ